MKKNKLRSSWVSFYSKAFSSLYLVFKLSKSKLIFHPGASTDGNNYFLWSLQRAGSPKLMKVEKIPQMWCNLSHIWQSIKLFFNLMTRYWWDQLTRFPHDPVASSPDCLIVEPFVHLGIENVQLWLISDKDQSTLFFLSYSWWRIMFGLGWRLVSTKAR